MHNMDSLGEGSSEVLATCISEMNSQETKLAREVHKDLAAAEARVTELEWLLQLELKLEEVGKAQQHINAFSEGLKQSKDLRDEIITTESSNAQLRLLSGQLREEMMQLRQKSSEMHAEYEVTQGNIIRELCRQEELRLKFGDMGATSECESVPSHRHLDVATQDARTEYTQSAVDAQERNVSQHVQPPTDKDGRCAAIRVLHSHTPKPKPQFGMLLGPGVRRPGKRATTFAVNGSMVSVTLNSKLHRVASHDPKKVRHQQTDKTGVVTNANVCSAP